MQMYCKHAHGHLASQKAGEKLRLSKWKKLKCYGFRNGNCLIAVRNVTQKTGKRENVISPTVDENAGMDSCEEKLEELVSNSVGSGSCNFSTDNSFCFCS